MNNNDLFVVDQGVFVPHDRPCHKNDEYDEVHFDMLLKMQRDHFWYRGRHELILKVLKEMIPSHFDKEEHLNAIDLGGGCGGWIEYLHSHNRGMFKRLALGDSSMRAMVMAKPVVGGFADRYQVDLLDLPWLEKWDVVFLLDVLEHVPNHLEVLHQVSDSIRKGGLIVVTVPALQAFWTYNDELALHQRRYCKCDFQMLAKQTALDLLRTEYFMFFLSPALIVNRLLFRPSATATPEEKKKHLDNSHRIPSKYVNRLLEKVMSLEASLVNHISFPWGTSLLAIMKK